MKKKFALGAVALMTVGFLSTGPSHAQDWPPSKTVTMYVGFAPGGAADTSARIIANKLAENIGQKVVVENKAGAGGNIVHAQVATGPADGTAILFGSIGPLSIAPHLMKVNYDPVKDLAPLSGGVKFPNIIVVPPELGVQNLQELVSLAKKDPGKLTYASTGSGSASHLQAELFNQRAGIEMVHVPYKGGSPAMVDLLGNRVSTYYAALPSAAPHVKAGKLVPIAVTGSERAAVFPDVPTIAESGYPGFDSTNWYAFVGSGKMPPAIQARWNQEIVKALKDPEVVAALEKHGLTPFPGSQQALADFIKKESDMWAKIIKDRNITQ